MAQSCKIRVPAFAKINLTLKVLHKRPDNYHELRTVFQTIDLADRLEIELTPARNRSIELASSIEIPNNLVLRAADAVANETNLRAGVRIRLTKHIPMGGGLGGGSTDAAAILLALPALAGKRIPAPRLAEIAASLGSDVPFFLLGGTALGLGRGEELYPFPQPRTSSGLLLTSGLHVATPNAFQALRRNLTVTPDSLTINRFQSLGWPIGEGLPVRSWHAFCQNDFEEVVFHQHPKLRALKKKLLRAGASPAMMTGSGSALFGFFDTKPHAERAAKLFPETGCVIFRSLTRKQYQAAWYKCLRDFVRDDTWPPLSRYAR